LGVEETQAVACSVAAAAGFGVLAFGVGTDLAGFGGATGSGEMES
jgi:hypothetical protein